jgi:hypothetical protein
VSLVVAGMLALSLGACAETDAAATRNAYVRQINAAQARFARTDAEVADAMTKTSSVRQGRRSLVHFGAVVGGIVKTLRGVAVPAGVHAEHAGLVAALAGFRKELSAIVIVLRSPTTHAIDEADRRLEAAKTSFDAKLTASIGAINAKLKAG